MERESFEDHEVARIMNSNYVAIKVDREERKDIDTIYMKVCQAITGSGGWPLNVWLTPDKLPIYAGTYFPKKAFMNRTGLMDALTYIQQLFIEKPQALFNQSFEIITSLKKSENRKPGSVRSTLVEEVDKAFHKNFDPDFGGFSKQPKFPTPYQLMYLLDSKEEAMKNMAFETLSHMARGGIYDHLGGGFSRYSVDHQWLIPHFEKMLYDNGQLLDAYAKAYAQCEEPLYEQIVMETVDFMEREWLSPYGGFYSAFDADSEGIEGKFYRFKYDEILEVLGKEEGKTFCEQYGVTPFGNFEGFSVLNRIDGNKYNDLLQSGEIVSHYFDDGRYLHEDIQAMKKKLYEYRELRIKPMLDDKILSLSNGLALHGLLSVYEVFELPKALSLAQGIYAYITTSMWDEKGLYASCRDQKKGPLATLDDYGAVIRGFLKLFMVTQEETILKQSLMLIDECSRYFWDEEDLGYCVGRIGSKDLIFNPKELYDGAIPSGNSLMVQNMYHAFLLTQDEVYKKIVDEMIEYFGEQLNRYSMYAGFFVQTIRWIQTGVREVTITVPNQPAKELFLEMYTYPFIVKKYSCYTYRVVVDELRCIDGHTTEYICEHGACQPGNLFKA